MTVIGLAGGVDLSQTSSIVLVQQPDEGDNGGQGEDAGKASPLGLVVLILFGIAVVFLIRSMTKHLKKVPQSFDNPSSTDAPDGSDADSSGSDGDEPSAG